MKLDKVLYTAKAHTTGGRDGGSSRTSDGRLDVKLSVPGGAGSGTNPEQLFAAGYAACFIGAMRAVSAAEKVRVPPDAQITSEVGIGPRSEGGFGITVALDVHLPGVDRADAERLVQAAHQVCPYSNATRGNVDVKLKVV